MSPEWTKLPYFGSLLQTLFNSKFTVMIDLSLFLCGLFVLVSLGVVWLKMIQANSNKPKQFSSLKSRYYV